MKKTISIITFGGILMLFVYACSADFLDTKPANVISTAGVWDNADLAVQVVNGVYNALRADYATNSGYDGDLHFYDYRSSIMDLAYTDTFWRSYSFINRVSFGLEALL